MSESSKVLKEEENVLSFDNKSEAEDSLQDLNKTIANLTVLEPKMSATYFSLESEIPFMQYASTEDRQKMVAVDLLVQAADKDKFHVKMTKCGRYLHVRSAVPDIFLDLTYQRRAEQNNTIYHENSSKAVVFDTLVEKIETKVNLNKDRFGPHQIIKMIKPCDPNVDIDYKTIYWKPQPRFAV